MRDAFASHTRRVNGCEEEGAATATLLVCEEGAATATVTATACEEGAAIATVTYTSRL